MWWGWPEDRRPEDAASPDPLDLGSLDKQDSMAVFGVIKQVSETGLELLDKLGVVWALVDAFLLEPILADAMLPLSVAMTSSGLFGERVKMGEVGRGEDVSGEGVSGEGVSGGEMGVGEGEMDPRLD